MVKKVAAALTMILLPISLIASVSFKGGVDLDAVFMNADSLGGWVSAYVAEPRFSVLFSSEDLKAEAEGTYMFFRSTDEKAEELLSHTLKKGFNLEKAYVKFRFPSFNDGMMSLTAGRIPVSWGMGSYYRIGDTLFLDDFSNEEIGKDKGRSTWIVSASQSFGDIVKADIAFVPPFDTDTGKEKLAAMLSASFDDRFFKEARVSYSYDFSNVHKASALIDMNLFLDVVLGVESTFSAPDDAKALINISKSFSVEAEDGNSYPMNVFLCSLLDFEAGKYHLLPAYTVGIGSRTSVSLFAPLEFGSAGFGYALGASASFLMVDGVDIKCSVSYSDYEEAALTASLGMQARF